MICSINMSASNLESLIVLTILPNQTTFKLNINIYGLISASNTLYTSSINIKVITKNSNYQNIDEGIIKYNISCN